MKRFWWLISLLLLFISSNNVYSQIDDWLDYSLDCNDYHINDTLIRENSYNSINGYHLSPHGMIRMLVVFVELDYTDTIPDPSSSWHNHYWDAHSLPRWADSLFAAYDTTNFRYKRVTRYYQYASSNNHIVLGDCLIANGNNGVFRMNTVNGEIMVDDLIYAINQNYGNNSLNTSNGFSYSDFDNWSTNNIGQENLNQPNGKWDFVVFIIRNAIAPQNHSGYSSYGTSSQLLGHGLDGYSVLCAGDTYNPIHVIRHEYAHMLLGGNDFHTCGGGWADSYNYWIPQSGGWALLGLYGSSLMCWNAWDRYRLGWIGSGNTYEISARASDGVTEVNGDLDISNGNGIYVLRDFVTTGDALRIKLPYIDEETAYPEWIWLENHQGVVNNDIEFDQWQYQYYECVESFHPGLMAYIQINSNIRESTNVVDVYTQYADYLNPLTANGFWDRCFLTESVNNECVSNKMVRPFMLLNENPLTGCGDQSHYSIDLDGNDTLSSDPENRNKQDQLSNWTKKDGSTYHKNLFQLGHSSHSFNLNGNKKIGIGTNPSSAPLINMVGQQTQCADAKNLRTTYLNGVSIEILEQNTTNGDIKVRIRFDDVDVDNDVRWCSDSIVLNNIPTSSGYSLDVKRGKTITLDQGLTATRMTDPITFNGQKIFASPTTLTIQPNVKIHIDTIAKIVLENASKLHFRDKSECVIEDEGYIEVKCGSVFQLDDCASLIIKGRGQLVADSGAILRISNYAHLECLNGVQNLDIDNDVIIPDGYADPTSFLTPSVENLQINGNVTWENYNKTIYGIVTINDGATLNVKSSFLRFKDETCGINVDRGGKLIIDNSTLTSLCPNDAIMWRGIEVWGNRNENQFPINGNYLQGYLELKNDAVIENALCAVELCKPDSRNHMGGIIHATDAIFRNNAKSVHAYSYTNHHPSSGNEADYNGWFRKCTFTIDTDYFGDRMFSKHVELDIINGMAFNGCDFSVIAGGDSISSSCVGISAINSGFGVFSYCDDIAVPCPDSSIKRCSFSGFDNGVFAICQGDNVRTFTIQGALFSNNNNGIYAENVGYATIINNEFHIGKSSPCNYGIYLNAISSFCIEENTFQYVNDISGIETYGIAVLNTNSINDIYRNTFENLTYGNISLGTNFYHLGHSYPGLTYSCNENYYNEIDFVVDKYNGYGGIQQNQGSFLIPAGNTFSGSKYHFYNDGDFNINYYYNSIQPNEIPTRLIGVTATPTTYSNDCASHYGGGGNVEKTPEEKTALADIYKLKNEEYNFLKTQYNSQIASGITPKPELLAHMTQCLHDRNMAAGDIVRSNLNENEANLPELRLWLARMHTLDDDRMLVASYIQEGDFTNAITLANTLPTVYNLQKDGLIEYNDYMTLLYLYQTLYNTNRTIQDLTEKEYETVSDIAEYGVGKSKSMAKAIMIGLSNRYENNCLCFDMPEINNRELKMDTEDIVEENNCLTILLSPMPVSTWVSVDYKLPQDNAKATMTIINPFGVKAMEVELAGNKGTKTLDLRNLANGVYTYIVRCGESVKTGKLVVTR